MFKKNKILSRIVKNKFLLVKVSQILFINVRSKFKLWKMVRNSKISVAVRFSQTESGVAITECFTIVVYSGWLYEYVVRTYEKKESQEIH